MALKEYFENNEGFGVLSTADEEGRVDSAVYAKPHITANNLAAFVTGGKLTRANLAKNPYAVYLFREEGSGYRGKRLYLKKEKESDDPAELKKICREAWPAADESGYCERGRFVLFFRVDSVLPLVGTGGKTDKTDLRPN